METFANSHNELLPQLFRMEYSKMTAVIGRLFGLHAIEIAEDIVSETFLKAAEVWRVNGKPENPTAWLYTVAKNKTRDYLKRVNLFESKIKGTLPLIIGNNELEIEQDLDFTHQIISDSQLAMIFAVCNPVNSTEAQICLALKILCGFSIEEIASAFLAKTETIKKRLLRARANLRNPSFKHALSHPVDASPARLEAVLRVLYLLFNEGYFSKTDDHLIRKDLCSEAIRLTLVLTEHAATNTTETNALLALMCFQSSRLDARANDAGEAILFEEQDKSLWSKELIAKGNYYLVNACLGNEISKYHLEAGIAYWHTTPTGQNKWEHILQLYNQLIILEYSPLTALNRAFAIGKVYGHKQAIQEVKKLNLTDLNYYHALLGYLYADTNIEKAKIHYEQAITLSTSISEKNTLMKVLKRLKAQG
ncbi:RNA polymerase sigma factor [Longitalea luteola]|uniref:RNA polymerase sigma factor n=1 Tax=Longitalea luteola TaxID=2812563 RepID=UPI001A96FF0F|nr:sigma-70 family RNA polymerase sigma factor [Longitalea luteola]